MNPERWQRVQALVEEALARPRATRGEFVETACGAETELRDEVLSLLAASAVDEMPAGWLATLAGPEPARFAPGQRVAGRYVIGSLLGRGGMGEVYEARDEALSISVALKTLRRVGDDAAALQQLKLEGLLARTVWHPNVCRVYDLGGHDEDGATIWFLTMERLQGVTLAERLRVDKRLSVEHALRLAEHMAAGLGAAHQAGVVHRDFKPGNVMLVGAHAGERAVVTDFGTARAAQTAWADRQDGASAIIGTPAYMAPEQVRGEESGPAADIYSLGITLYEMVTGAPPFTGDSPLEVARRRLEEDAPSPRSVVPDLDERWVAVLRRCLAREPRQRFVHVEDVTEALAGRAAVEPRAGDLSFHARHTLPAERDLFVGRIADLEALENHLAVSRLVTLLGAGGMGKTRLAVHHGWRSVRSWPGGVWFCDLTEARDLHGIVSAVAGALGIEISRGDPLETLGHAIAARGRCLLIVDNFERVTAHAAETVGRWLKQAPEARCMVTSRERLSLERERVQPVEPLTIEAGLELFEARARGLCPALELVGVEAEAAREIVRLVDGMPLAIELAAARTRVMSASRIVAEMRRRFQLLTGGRDARHETLERTIDGSWDLLTPWERTAWAQCSVFEGGFTLEAAQGVLDLGARPEAPVLEIIQSLVDKCLLRTSVPHAGFGEHLPEVRFGMYASLHEYASMKLRENDPASGTVEERHGAWFAREGADEAIDSLDRHDGTARRRRLALEIENVTVACRRALWRGDERTSAATYRAAAAVIITRGPFGEAVELGREVLAGLRLDSGDKAAVLEALGEAEMFAGQMEDARSHWQEALAIARRSGERRIEGTALGWLGRVHLLQGRMDEARAHFEGALAIHRELGSRHFEAVFTEYLGAADVEQCRMDEARERLESALALYREEGNRRSEAKTLGMLAILHRDRGHLGEALREVERALAIHREVGDRRMEGLVMGQLATVRYDQGDFENARSGYQAALGITREVGARRVEGVLLANLGNLDLRMGHLDDARAHLEAALPIARQIGDLRVEGTVLGNLADVLLLQDRIEEARAVLTGAETILRRIDFPTVLGNILCSRAALERRSGNKSAAIAALNEARAILVKIGAGPDSELARNLALQQEAMGDPA